MNRSLLMLGVVIISIATFLFFVLDRDMPSDYIEGRDRIYICSLLLLTIAFSLSIKER